MSKNLANLRFGVVDEKYGHSSVWRLWVTKHGDIYLATKGMAGMLKVSFHKSGICRYAYTTEFANTRQVEDRLLHKWLRPKVPEAHANQIGRLCSLGIPTNYLSHPTSGPDTKLIQVPAAPPSGTTVIEIGVTRDSENTVLATTGEAVDWGMLLWAPLSADVSLFVRWYHSEEIIGDMNMPASHGLSGYRFAHPELEQPARPIRLHMQSNPADHDCLFVIERGGCCID